MFTRAGFNPRHRVVCYAMLWHRGLHRARPVCFMPSGDRAWVTRHGIFWPHMVEMASFIHLAVPVAFDQALRCPVDVPPADRAKWGRLP